MRDSLRGSYNWDDPLPPHLLDRWSNWKDSLKSLEDVHIPRTYAPISLQETLSTELHIFSDASETAIASVAYLLTVDASNNIHVGFVLGKSKLAPMKGHSVPRLELRVAVMSVQIYDIISDELDISFNSVRFYTDSLVVLGYIHNQSRRFYKYVENRIERIRKSTTPDQWNYVPTKSIPADSGTRNVTAEDIINNRWILGPPQLREPIEDNLNTEYHLCDPENDTEIRKIREVETLKTTTDNKNDQLETFHISHS
ncbi:uncharacterized protein LOC133192395 [Saccostrea echinata]|uniref:uncharacterized protein LOC133192395 n=1 Tax=Saccostrea echinata TaxID=191078 RepID=UPI002A7EDBA8|nr:uncharacterized protein LOC133192395 [Saccostrea echinata]